MNRINLGVFSIFLTMVSFGVIVSPSLPDMMASHWDIHGDVDGSMGRFWGVYLIPAITLIVVVIFWLIPHIDPLKNNIVKFRKYYDRFMLVLVLFLAYIHFLTIFFNLGIRFDMLRMIIPAVAVLFYFAGIMMEKSKRNYMVGIRTPWTLHSDDIWDRTHKLGGLLFKFGSVMLLISLVSSSIFLPLLILTLLLVSVVPIVYSYILYKKKSGK
jgi:uncharacterized membrane protein